MPVTQNAGANPNTLSSIGRKFGESALMSIVVNGIPALSNHSSPSGHAHDGQPIDGLTF
jgi:hypothetical protein